MVRRSLLLLGIMVGFLLPLSAGAETREAPDEDVILTVLVANDGVEKPVAHFTMTQLQAMPQTSFSTKTVWTDGPQEFTGIALTDLVAHLSFETGMLEAWAINDYLAEIPMSDVAPGGPIIAYFRNGSPMSIREKGPLWVVYPYDSDPAYQREEIFVRSVWQLNRIVWYP